MESIRRIISSLRARKPSISPDVETRDVLWPLPKPGSIIAALFFLEPERWHWIIYTQTGRTRDDGLRLDVRDRVDPDTGVVTWSYTPGKQTLHVGSLSTAKVLGYLPRGWTPQDLQKFLEAIPVGVVPMADVGREPNFRCRVWFREAMRRLTREGILHYPDVDRIEEELKTLAREQDDVITRSDELVKVKLWPM